MEINSYAPLAVKREKEKKRKKRKHSKHNARAALVQHHLSLGCVSVCSVCLCSVMHVPRVVCATCSSAAKSFEQPGKSLGTQQHTRLITHTQCVLHCKEATKKPMGREGREVSICSPGKYLNFIIHLVLLLFLSRVLYCFDIYVNI